MFIRLLGNAYRLQLLLDSILQEILIVKLIKSDCIINVLGQSDTELKFLFPVPELDLFDDTISSL